MILHWLQRLVRCEAVRFHTAGKNLRVRGTLVQDGKASSGLGTAPPPLVRRALGNRIATT